MIHMGVTIDGNLLVQMHLSGSFIVYISFIHGLFHYTLNTMGEFELRNWFDDHGSLSLNWTGLTLFFQRSQLT